MGEQSVGSAHIRSDAATSASCDATNGCATATSVLSSLAGSSTLRFMTRARLATWMEIWCAIYLITGAVLPIAFWTPLFAPWRAGYEALLGPVDDRVSDLL